MEPRPSDTQTMYVIACTADGGTTVEQRARPVPGAGEVRLRLHCCGLCGTDLFKLAHATEAAGTVLGHELVGTIDAVGPEVPTLSVGDRVVVPHHVACGACDWCRKGADTQCTTFKENLLLPGGFSEYLVAHERAVRHAAWRVPDQVSDAAAVFLEPTACVLRGVDKAKLDCGPGCAVVFGAGSMGLLHLLLLRATLPELAVVVCDPLAERRALALRLGAGAACTPTEEELAPTVNGLSAGVGADAVFDTVGGNDPLRLGLSVARPGGTVVLFAHAGDGEIAGYELNPFFKSEHRVVGTYSGGLAEQRRVAELLARGLFDPSPLVTHRLPMSRFDHAVTLARDHQALKILIEPDP